MIRIRYNNEVYEVTHVTSRGITELACVDYTEGIEDHVQSIIEVMAACNVEYVLEKL